VKHGTLKTTPAVAAGLTDHKWTIAEMVERIASFSPVQPKQDWQAFLDTLPDDE
jgi:hypothetical protein